MYVIFLALGCSIGIRFRMRAACVVKPWFTTRLALVRAFSGNRPPPSWFAKRGTAAPMRCQKEKVVKTKENLILFANFINVFSLWFILFPKTMDGEKIKIHPCLKQSHVIKTKCLSVQSFLPPPLFNYCTSTWRQSPPSKKEFP